MKLANRYCQCHRKALTPKNRRKPRMRGGYFFRKSHDLCARCFREEIARVARLWSDNAAAALPAPRAA